MKSRGNNLKEGENVDIWLDKKENWFSNVTVNKVKVNWEKYDVGSIFLYTESPTLKKWTKDITNSFGEVKKIITPEQVDFH